MKKRTDFVTIFFVFICLFGKAATSDLPGEKESPDREQQQLQWRFIFSNSLGFNIGYVSNPRIYKTISEWIGVPYKYSGGNKKGIDCSGFVCRVYKDCYNNPLDGSAQEIFKKVDAVKRDDLREGDLIFFKIKSKRISHVGVYLGQNKFAHASVHRGVIVSDLNDPYYLKYYYKGGRIKIL